MCVHDFDWCWEGEGGACVLRGLTRSCGARREDVCDLAPGSRSHQPVSCECWPFPMSRFPLRDSLCCSGPVQSAGAEMRSPYICCFAETGASDALGKSIQRQISVDAGSRFKPG